MKYDTPIWHRIEELRTARGLTVVGLAEASGVSRSHIYSIGRGERGAGVEQLARLARVLGVPMSDLLFYMYGIRADGGDPLLEQSPQAERHPSPRLRTGFARLDRMTESLRPGQVVLLHGDAKAGKTALAMQWVEAVGQNRAERTSAVVFTRTPEGENSGSVMLRMTQLWIEHNSVPDMVNLGRSPRKEDVLCYLEPRTRVVFDCPHRALSRNYIARRLRIFSARIQPSLTVIDGIDSLVTRQGLPEVLTWLKDQALTFALVLVAVLDAALPGEEAASLVGQMSAGESSGVDLVLHLSLPAHSSSTERRIVAEDGTGVGYFTNLRFDSDEGLLRE